MKKAQTSTYVIFGILFILGSLILFDYYNRKSLDTNTNIDQQIDKFYIDSESFNEYSNLCLKKSFLEAADIYSFDENKIREHIKQEFPLCLSDFKDNIDTPLIIDINSLQVFVDETEDVVLVTAEVNTIIEDEGNRIELTDFSFAFDKASLALLSSGFAPIQLCSTNEKACLFFEEGTVIKVGGSPVETLELKVDEIKTFKHMIGKYAYTILPEEAKSSKPFILRIFYEDSWVEGRNELKFSIAKLVEYKLGDQTFYYWESVGSFVNTKDKWVETEISEAGTYTIVSGTCGSNIEYFDESSQIGCNRKQPRPKPENGGSSSSSSGGGSGGTTPTVPSFNGNYNPPATNSQTGEETESTPDLSNCEPEEGGFDNPVAEIDLSSKHESYSGEVCGSEVISLSGISLSEEESLVTYTNNPNVDVVINDPDSLTSTGDAYAVISGVGEYTVNFYIISLSDSYIINMPLLEKDVPAPSSQYYCFYDRRYKGSTAVKAGVWEHRGTDFPVQYIPVVSATEGIVTSVGFSDTYYGAYAMIMSPGCPALCTVYAHMVREENMGDDYVIDGDYHNPLYDLTIGDQINIGDVIGVASNSGSAKGTHLHFELRLNSECTATESGISAGDSRRAVSPLYLRPYLTDDLGELMDQICLPNTLGNNDGSLHLFVNNIEDIMPESCAESQVG